MARLWSCGFELNSSTSGIEYDTNGGATSVISTTQSHSGTYSSKISFTSTQTTNSHQFGTSATTYLRAWVYMQSYPNSTVGMINLAVGATSKTGINMTSAGVLIHANALGNTVTSQTIPLNSWHYVELLNDATPASGSRVQVLRYDGNIINTVFGLTSIQCVSVDTVSWGNLGNGSTVGVAYYDDIAVNDGTGSFQNSWPGKSSLCYLLPSAAGDSTQWTPDSGSNFARANEVTPDDATSLVKSNTLNNSDFYSVGVSPLLASDSVNVVHVGARFVNDIADATTAFKLQIKKTSGGTVALSSAIIPNTTTWSTNAVSQPRLYPVTLYQDPDSTNWTSKTVNSMQIGHTLSTGGTNNVEVTKVWAVVDYSPRPGSFNNYQFVSAGDGMSTTEKIR